MATRSEFLERIRREVRKTDGLFPASPAARPPAPREAAELVKRQMAERWSVALARFSEEFERIGGVFHRVRDRSGVPEIIAAIARRHQARELVIWGSLEGEADLGQSLECQGLRVTVAATGSPDSSVRAAHREAAARAPLGVTGVDFVLAETGTLVLVSGSGHPRSTSLLPDVHVAIFGKDRLVESMQQLGLLLEALHVEPDRSMSGAVINFITGPSRTADIELTLTRGVHGPKEVHAVFVEVP